MSRQLQIQQRAVALLAQGQKLVTNGWTRGVMARSASRREVAITSPAACAFCSVGALRRAAIDLGEPSVQVYEAALGRLQKVMGGTGPNRLSVVNVNDARTTTQEDVAMAFQLAQLAF